MAKEMNPERVAYYEAEGWRAYYDRKYLRLLRLLVSLCHEQFSMPWPRALLGSYYATRASVAWIPLNHDEAKVLHYYEKFYRLARRYSGLVFDPARVAGLELRYNDDHRRLIGTEDKAPLLQTLVDLHSALFGISPEEARESAEWRLRALNTVDGITGKTSTDVAGDWRKLEAELVRCYSSIALRAGHAQEPRS
ncbi:MAG TPA: hypothetical protein VJB57_06785 [Dehalococcoidia bacterium]|nr:hypothetical protein [Dehalococcoidia bacterium]